MLLRILIFLILNFAALGVGGLFTSSGVTSEWYTNLNKAPWTPPGWVFGFAWTTIMIGFSIYLAYLWPQTENKSLLLMLFALQWVLNTGWNPVFFYFHQLLAGLVIIVLLTLLVRYLFFLFWPSVKWISLLLLPYIIWLCIATSLNGYAYLKN